MSTATMDFKPKLWVAGDLNAFFGFGTNILVNLLVVTGLLRFVLKMPDELVFGKILPATGLMMCIGTLYYAWLGYRLVLDAARANPDHESARRVLGSPEVRAPRVLLLTKRG